MAERISNEKIIFLGFSPLLLHACARTTCLFYAAIYRRRPKKKNTRTHKYAQKHTNTHAHELTSGPPSPSAGRFGATLRSPFLHFPSFFFYFPFVVRVFLRRARSSGAEISIAAAAAATTLHGRRQITRARGDGRPARRTVVDGWTGTRKKRRCARNEFIGSPVP